MISKLQGPLPPPLVEGTIPTVLAPMQDVTDLPFMRVINQYGDPDYYFTEYFRVYPHSRLDKHILSSITENDTGRPVVAQLLGNSLPDIRRIVEQLEQYPVAAIDLNCGCPAPKIYKNMAGGGLLTDLDKLDGILGTLRDSVKGSFSVKIRIGFDSFEPFVGAMELIRKHGVDFLTIHARTVKEMYRGEPHYEYIRQAVELLDIPVYANGNITSAAKARHVMQQTGATGVMIGRHAIRNPWIFTQIREFSLGKTLTQPTLADVRQYIRRLYEMSDHWDRERSRINHLKKYVNFIGQSVDPNTRFIKAMRRCHTELDFFKVCDEHLVENGRGQAPFPMEPYEGVVARPNCEDGHVEVIQECRL